MSGKNRLNSFILFVYIIGETRDRLDLAFSMYDINGDGLLDKKDIS
jgi:Ca2+-binding EF-hand superfamily protein